MSSFPESSDVTVLDLLRSSDGMRVDQLAATMGVTDTAVRQRLVRLSAKELIERQQVQSGRGRPHYQYKLTEKGRRQTGSNLADLAIALCVCPAAQQCL